MTRQSPAASYSGTVRWFVLLLVAALMGGALRAPDVAADAVVMIDDAEQTDASAPDAIVVGEVTYERGRAFENILEPPPYRPASSVFRPPRAAAF